jgi:hypothetical protein
MPSAAGQLQEASLTGPFDAFGGDGILEGGVDGQAELGDGLDDSMPTRRALLGPVQVGLAGQEKLAQALTGTILIAGGDHSGTDDIEDPGGELAFGLVDVGDHRDARQ